MTRNDVPDMLMGPVLAGVPVTHETALRLVDVLACVRLLAESASVLPLLLYRREADRRDRLEDHPLSRLLRLPAPATTQANLVAQTVGSLAARGNAFWGLFRDADGALAQVAVLPVDRVKVDLQAGGQPRYVLTDDHGRQTTHGTRDILHFKGLSTDGRMGLSPIAQCREALGLATALQQSASALHGNGSLPQGVLSVVNAGPGAQDQVDSLAHDFEARHKGSEKRGRVAVLSGDVTFHALSLSPSDAELVAQRKLSTTEVARLFRVPPSLIAAESGNSLTYTNSELEGINFMRFSLQPWLTVVEQGVSSHPDLTPAGCWWEFNVDAMLRPDSKTRADVYALALDPEKGWMTRDEVRALERLNPEGARVASAA
jgi:HK97 family phage portal protein